MHRELLCRSTVRLSTMGLSRTMGLDEIPGAIGGQNRRASRGTPSVGGLGPGSPGASPRTRGAL